MLKHKIYALCNENRWFTCGTIEQYEKMFQMVETGSSARDVAMVIWFCSEVASFESVYFKVADAYRECRNEYYVTAV